MKLFKKLLFIVFGLIALIAISFYLFLKVREYRSKDSLVHRESECIAQVAVDKILTDISWNAIMNPGFYLGKDTVAESSVDSLKRDKLGMPIPSNIYLFTLKNSEGVWYSFLDIEDEYKLQDFICNQLGIDSANIERQADIWWLTGKNNKISFLGNSQHMLMAISIDRTDKKEKMMEIWEQRTTTMVPVKTLNDFSFKGNADIQWLQKGSGTVGSLSFKKGIIAVDFFLSNNLLRLPKEVKVRQLPDSNVLNVYCSADIRPLLDKYAEDLQRYNIPVDTLKQYYGGYFDLQWRSNDVLQRDSIIAYDYDANFNPIEKKELREEAVPNIIFMCSASPHIAGYLPEKMFYKFHKSMDGDQIGLSTDQNAITDYPYVSAENAVFLSYKYNAAAQRHLGWISQIDKIEGIIIKGKGLGETNSFQTEVTLKNDKIHALYQLLK